MRSRLWSFTAARIHSLPTRRRAAGLRGWPIRPPGMHPGAENRGHVPGDAQLEMFDLLKFQAAVCKPGH